MCGIWTYFLRHGHLFEKDAYLKNDPWKYAAAARGPDSTTEIQGSDYHMVFHRLAINDIKGGDQPFYGEWREDGTVMHLLCNGEIYNYEEIVKRYRLRRQLKSKSDCEVIWHLLEEFGGNVDQVVAALRGEYAFVARMEKPSGEVTIVAARDMFGVRPLYYTNTSKGIAFCSLMAGLAGLDEKYPNHVVRHFPPGSTYTETITSPNSQMRGMFHEVQQFRPQTSLFMLPSMSIRDYYKNITDALIDAVRVRLTSGRKIGFLLSGGLDSSLVVAIATRILGVQNPATFCIGFDENGSDLKYARQVAAHCGTRHEEVIVAPKDALEEVETVIKALETYDQTTVRASIPQYLLARHIAEKTDVRVLLNGDGSDEVANGYLYSYYAPSALDAHEDAVRLLKEIHCFDGLRVDRTLGAHGLEARLPFLDQRYVHAYLSVPPTLRIPTVERMEKQVLRDAFATLYPDILPRSVLYRTKHAFSDAVSADTPDTTSWIDHLKKACETARATSETAMDERAWYKSIFVKHFPNQMHILPHYWLPPRDWYDADDPSAKTLPVYEVATRVASTHCTRM